MAHFNRSIAIIIGINQYQNGVPPLTTAVNDASDLSQVLKADHGYQVVFMRDHQVTLASLKTLLVEKLPTIVQPSDRVLFYFAGHGLAFNGDAGPEGYLIPQDATLGDSKTYLPMTLVHDALTALACRHFLGIFDCCFAGAFRWSATRRLTPIPKVIHKERFDRFLTDPAWQVLTSAADDQEAMDALSLKDHRGHTGHHSPFAEALIQALKAESQADASPPAQKGKPAGDGVITATELYQYLRDAVEPGTLEHAKRQTPGLWPLKKHGKGEYIFLVPGRKPDLPEAPKLDEAANPYRGLESFEEVHQHLFFGRKQLIQELQEFVESHALTVVLGASGTGKSSVVKAGLVPALKQNLDIDGNPIWQVLPIVRPGVTPLKAVTQSFGSHDLGRTLANQSASAWGETLKTYLQQWQQQHPNQKLLLVIDQAEELFSLCREGAQRQQFLEMLAELLEQQSAQFHILLTLRSDFEPQFRNSPLELYWGQDRFLIRPMNREELRAAIEAPASAKVMYFDPPELVDRLIDEVNEMPGALPLLSFTLRELFLKYLRNASTRSNRAITEADYEELGGIKQALVNRAEEEYRALVEQDPAFADTVRHVMLRMVASGGTGNTRRQVLLSELDYAEPEGTRVQQVLSRYKAARLLVSDTTAEDQPYVEPAHDALVEGWPRLLQWLESGTAGETLGQQRKGPFRWLNNLGTKNNEASLDEREKLLLQRRLTPAANDWQREQKTKFLWHADARLPLLKQIRKGEPDWFNKTEGEFVKRSLGRKGFNVGLRWVSMFALLALSVGVGFIIEGFRQQAEDRRIEAERRNVLNLIENSDSSFESERFSEALISAIKAGETIQSEPELREEQDLRNTAISTLFRSYYGLGDQKESWEFYGIPGETTTIDIEANLVASSERNIIRVWALDSGDLLTQRDAESPPLEIILLPENNYLATISRATSIDNDDTDFTIDIWSIEDERPVPIENIVPNKWIGFIGSLQPSVIGKLLVNFDKGKTLETILDLASPEEIKEFNDIEMNSSNLWIAGLTSESIILLNPQLAVKKVVDDFSDTNKFQDSTSLGISSFIDSGTDEYRSHVLARDIVADDIAFSQNGEMLVSVGELNKVRKWDLEGELIEEKEFDAGLCNTLRQAGVSPDPYISNGTVYLGPDGNSLAVACINGTVKFWDIEDLSSEDHEQSLPLEINYFKDDDATGSFSGSFSSLVFDPTEPVVGIENVINGKAISKFIYLKADEKTKPYTIDEPVYDFSISPDGKMIALLQEDGKILILDREGALIRSFTGIEEDYAFFLGNYGDIGDGGLLGYKGRPRIVFSNLSQELAVSYGECKFHNNLERNSSEIVKYEEEQSIISETCHSSIIRIFDLKGNELNILSYPESVENIGFSKQDSLLFIIGEYAHFGIFDRQKNHFGGSDYHIPRINHSTVYSSALSADGKLFAIATGNDSSAGVEATQSLEIINLETEDRFDIPIDNVSGTIVDLSFNSMANVLTIGSSNIASGATFQALNLEDPRPIINEIEVSRIEGSKLISASLHPSEDLFAITTGQAGAGKILEISTKVMNQSGEVLIDFKNVLLEKVKFSHDGSHLNAIRLFNYGGAAFDGFLMWNFDLGTLLLESCNFIKDYLRSPLLSQDEREICVSSSADISFSPSVNSSHQILHESNEVNLDAKNIEQKPWYYPRFLRSSWSKIRQLISVKEAASQESFTALVPLLKPNLDFFGLGLSFSEQITFYQLHTQTTAWDIQGSLNSLAVLQSSDNPCVASFATEFATILNEQGNDGFRQITPIKEELNESQGCKLPLVPFEFSPLSGD